jgi:hypothetical protein
MINLYKLAVVSIAVLLSMVSHSVEQSLDRLTGSIDQAQVAHLHDISVVTYYGKLPRIAPLTGSLCTFFC